MWIGHLFWPLHGLGWGLFGVFGLFGLLFRWGLLAGVIVLIVVLASRAARSRGTAPRGESAEEILKRRYANGEISKEEYEQKLNDLR